VQLLAKVEELALGYEGAARGGAVDKTNADGDIRVTTVTFGANLWATKHLRFGVNYGYNVFPDSRRGALSSLHELHLRVGAQF
jgi:hypothetical protein